MPSLSMPILDSLPQHSRTGVHLAFAFALLVVAIGKYVVLVVRRWPLLSDFTRERHRPKIAPPHLEGRQRWMLHAKTGNVGESGHDQVGSVGVAPCVVQVGVVHVDPSSSRQTGIENLTPYAFLERTFSAYLRCVSPGRLATPSFHPL